ncbi:metal ABC transporter solute-binding protein, Zn/Mn family [Antarcticimicrobium luteum]|uniref:Manganese transporter n=1 Tax=Antarcticimicrobium luteum TaxID=2547397 RepID=A0A4R5V362_9RHOB|nr:zinc ABC transporter substrate-binding protein [Antarcticimicrobium luteum]TDK46269.1 manganese transporter [Antarcticimicrobium luteum]
MLSRRRVVALAAGVALQPLAMLPASAAQPLKVVATTGMIADAARQVGGDLVEVRALMGPGIDPHSYRQTRSDIVAMTRADLVLWHGLYLEAQMQAFFQAFGRKRPLVAVAEALPRGLLRHHDDYEDKFDPHIWMVPDLWKHAVAEVQRALTGVRPESAEIFAANAAAHLAALDRLSDYAGKTLAGVPEAARVLLTAHDAFGYFGDAYGFEVLGIQGISTESEAGLNRIGQLVDLLVARGIGAVFVESSVSDRNIRALIEGAGARGHTVRIGGELYSDAMGPEGSYEGTYIGMIDHNVTVIAGALGADAPARGMDGKLSAGS